MSGLLALFFGAALGNVIRGVPIGPDNFFFLPLWTNWQVGAIPGILDWYTVMGGVVALLALAIHGALYIAVKTNDDLHIRAIQIARRLWPVLALVTAVSLPATMIIRPSTLANYQHYPIAFLIPAIVVASLIGIFVFSRAARAWQAFLSSCAYLAFLLVGAAVALYPTLLPSRTDPARDITIQKALSGHYALSVGLIWWSVGIAIAIGYFVFVYRMFAGKVSRTPGTYEH